MTAGETGDLNTGDRLAIVVRRAWRGRARRSCEGGTAPPHTLPGRHLGTPGSGRQELNFPAIVVMPDLSALIRSEEWVSASRAMLAAALKYRPGLDAEKIKGDPSELLREDGLDRSLGKGSRG